MPDVPSLDTRVVSDFSDLSNVAVLIVPLTRSVLEDSASLPTPVDRALKQAGDDATAEAKKTALAYLSDSPVRRVLFVGVGEADDIEPDAYRQAAGKSASEVLDRKLEEAAIFLPAPASDYVQQLVEGFWLGAYRFTRYKTDNDRSSVSRLTIVGDGNGLKETVSRASALAHAVYTTRDLVNRSPDEKPATEFARLVRESGDEHGYEVEVWDEQRIAEEGMGGLLAVNRGSEDQPTFSLLTWKPEEHVNDQPIVIVGKGVMYDTGGLSLKDTKGSMDLMKSDMAGAATVVGVFEALASLGIPLHVIGLLPATDNRPGGRAYVPGDVIRMHSGATVEVLNTDAEGRMLLADALSFAQSLNPEFVVDLATLTGAAVVALGHEASPVMSPESAQKSALLRRFANASQVTGERTHPLPLLDGYKSQLESTVADIKNVGGRAGGCITAGKFLEHFVDYPWVHVDIAGTAFLQDARPYSPVGGTGFGVRLLVEVLRARANQS